MGVAPLIRDVHRLWNGKCYQVKHFKVLCAQNAM